jgi:hypothetical protein
MAWKDLHPFQPEILTDPASIRCLADFVLVKPFPPAGLIINPGVHMTQDYRWRQDRPRGNRTGTVVAIGSGDKMIGLACADCQRFELRLLRTDSDIKRLACECGGEKLTVALKDGTPMTQRAGLNVSVGDVVVFPRVPANEIEINGEEYVFLHEEQHVLAVIDEEIAA